LQKVPDFIGFVAELGQSLPLRQISDFLQSSVQNLGQAIAAIRFDQPNIPCVLEEA
jgi:hypothetical protein